MSYLLGLNSFSDEESWGLDSSFRSSLYNVQTNLVSYGELSAFDSVDWYELKLAGTGTYNLIVSNDFSNNYSIFNFWDTTFIGVKVEVTDRYGYTIGSIGSSTASGFFDGVLSFTYTGPPTFGEYYVKLTNLGFTNADYALTLSLSGTGGGSGGSGIVGGSGNDTLDGTSGSEVIQGLGGNDVIQGFGGNDWLYGDDGNDSLYGGDGNDTLSGGNGNDLLDGGGGNDSMTGGAGNDRYVVNASGDKVIETSGGGTDTISSAISYTLPSHVENLTLTGSSNVNGAGNTSSNTITGNTKANSLSGGDGNDSLYGGDGNDTLSGGNGNDLLDGGGGNDSMTGGAGNDRYVVNASGDKVIEASGGGTDSVSSAISYTLPSHVERLALTGSSNINGAGNTSSNTITGNTKANSLSGGDGNDSLIGVDGNDTLSGGNGNDALDGGIGNDSLFGGAGNDALTGGSGLDIFRFSSALGTSNSDTIADFNPTDDALQLENSVFAKLTGTGVLSSTFFRANTTGTASDTNDYVLYETDTGKLFYDADGNGTGAKALIATLTTLPALTSADIFIT